MNNNERLAKVETDISYIKDKMEEMHKDFKEFTHCADKKYASKLTERIVYALVGMIMIAVMTKILKVW